MARKYNKALLGRTEKEEAMADMMAEEAMDLRCLSLSHHGDIYSLFAETPGLDFATIPISTS